MRFQHCTRAQLNELADAATVVIPIGACEQHGPHLPVGTDYLLAEEIAVRAADAMDDFPVLVTPPIAVGNSGYHIPFGGTLSVTSDTLRAYLGDVCDSVIASGFRRIFVLNGHGGNALVISEVGGRVARDHDVVVATGSYWTIAWDALITAGAVEVGLLPGHAGAFETSMVRAMLPDLRVDPPVRPSDRRSDPRRFEPALTIHDPQSWARIDGFTDDPSAGTSTEGARFASAVVDAVVAALVEHRARA